MLADHSRHCGELGRRLMRPPALLIVIVNVSRIFLLLFVVSVDYPIINYRSFPKNSPKEA